MNQATLASGTVFQSRYELLSLLRESSFAVVYPGRQRTTGQPIILKVMRLADDPSAAESARRYRMQFLQEMRVGARLHHPNIPRLIDSGQTPDGQLYTVFEFIPGPTLTELLSEQGALDPQEAQHLMRQVLEALSYAHQQGLVHGDLCPARVRVVPGATRRDALVLGFGAASASVRGDEDGAPVSGVELVGSQNYAAPKQRRGFPPTARSDLYAWGRVFLECLTGRREGCGGPPDGEAVSRESHESVHFPPALLGHPLGAILRRATREDVAARTVTAEGLLRELDSCDASGLRREDLTEPGVPFGAVVTGETEEEKRREASEAGSRGSAALAQRQPKGLLDDLDDDNAPSNKESGVAATHENVSPSVQVAPGEEPPGAPAIARSALAHALSSPTPNERGHLAEPVPVDAAATPAELIAGGMPPGIGIVIKQYEIIRKLGEGGMATVFLARDTKLGRLVAIKFLLKWNGRHAKRFLAEARATARCRHDNIVVIHEVDEIRGYPYMVLEYIRGPTLRAWMARRERPSGPGRDAAPDTPPGPVPPSMAVELMIPVVRALICAHELGIVHRDLKPENILLDESGSIKVLDFGIAKQLEAKKISPVADPLSARPKSADGGRPRPRAVIGTPPYMSPEQLLGRHIDHRTDLWAVGIMLYELLIGVHPLAPFSLARLADIVDFNVPMPSAGETRTGGGALGALIDHCLKKRKDERIGSAKELLAELEALLPGRNVLDLGEGENPFAGLAAFQEADAARFFGRDREIAAVVTWLRNQQLLAVAGPSGSGKSSFVRAGVIPALKRSGDHWEAFTLRPGRRPLAALIDVLAKLNEAASLGAAAGSSDLADHDALVPILRTQPGYLGAQLRARCRREGRRHHILLFVDQFEELYTLGATREERAAFIACLEGVADDASSPLRILIAIRSDFLDRLADEHQFMADVTRGLSFLPPMERDGLREALTRPIDAAGHRFETAEMVEHMLDTLESTRSPLPLLQFTATKLWEARDRERRLLTRSSYEKFGGVVGALSAHADTVLSALSLSDQRLARAVVLRLVTPERTRAVVSLKELCELAQDGETGAGEAIAYVVQHLASARLLLVETGGESDGEHEGTTVELVHESLIDRWTKLGQWLAENEQDAQFLARLRAAAQQWEASGQAEGFLWRDRAAQDARAWHGRRHAEQGADKHTGLGKREERYLLAVVAFAERARHLRQRLIMGAMATLSAIALIVSCLALRAEQQATHAKQQAARADLEATRAQTEALQARNAARMATARELQADPTTALAILREVEPPDVPRGWADLARWALHSRVASVVLTHPEPVYATAFSPDGKRIVTACWDRTVRVWNADGTGQPLVLRGHEEVVSGTAFSPDGKRIVTASFDKTARVWNADGTGHPLVLRGHEGEVVSAAFSRDGKRIVTASNDETARVWNADGTGHPLVLRGHEAQVSSAEFSPDGKCIVTASDDKTARVWNADGTGHPLVLLGHENGIRAVAFSPDGKRIVTASEDKTARVWNVDGTGHPLVLLGHENGVDSAAFDPDGKRIVTSGWDKTVRVWNADGTGQSLIFYGHGDGIRSVAFSPNGERIVSASFDKTVRVWNVVSAGVPLVLRGHDASVYSAAFSPDGKRIVTASYDKTARVWNADGTGKPLILRGHEAQVSSAAFSPDGKRIVTASHDKTARVWNANGTGQPLVLRRHEAPVNTAAFSPDGKRIVTASDDKTARVWSADGTKQLLVLRGHEAALHSAAFSPDGKRIVTASKDRTARVWNADGTGVPLVLRGHKEALHSAAFSPDGKRIVTASKDKTARVWNANGTGEPLVLRDHEHWVLEARFSPDGEHIVTGSQDQTVRIWRSDGSGEPVVLRGTDSPVNTVAFSRDGKRIVSGTDDKAVQVWTDLDPLRSVQDPKLWTMTTYCMPVERRIELLRVPKAMAQANRDACLRRVEAARATATAPRSDPGVRQSGSADP